MKAVHVVGSGTGANYSVTLGAIEAIEAAGVEILSMTSTSGSGLSMSLLASGLDTSEVRKIMLDCLPRDVIHKRLFPFLPFGLHDMDGLKKILGVWLPKTFAGMDPGYSCVAMDSDTGERVVYSKTKTPEASVVDAVIASASVPFFFAPVGHMVDGGVGDNLALDVPPSDGVPVVAILVRGPMPKLKPWRSLLGFTRNVLSILLSHGERIHIETDKWEATHVIVVNTPTSSLDFDAIDEAAVERLRALGYRRTMDYLDEPH